MDKESFKQLLKDAHIYCIPRLIKLTNSKADAEDAFMEASYQLWQSLQTNKIKHQNNLKAFILVNARNKWLNKNRKEKGGKIKTYSSPSEVIETYTDQGNNIYNDENFDPLVKAENEARLNLKDEKQKQALKQALQQLNEKCRSLLIQSIVHKKKLKDLQQSLGFVSINAIKMAKSRCRKTLMQQIELILNSKN